MSRSVACVVPRRAGGNVREEERIAAWVRSLEKPAGVFCATDRYALRLLNVCRVLNVAVPEEVAVLGIDNDPVICGLSFPPLSSIEQNPRRIGYEAADLLTHKMAGDRSTQKMIVVPPSHVVVRQSTGGLAIDDSDVAQAVRFIREHACRRITVDQVAQAVSLSRLGVGASVPCLFAAFAQAGDCAGADGTSKAAAARTADLGGRRCASDGFRIDEPFHQGFPPGDGRYAASIPR